MSSGMTPSECSKKAWELTAAGRYAEAIFHCQQPACCDVVECQRQLGWLYYRRDEFDNSLRWFTRAVEQGDVASRYGMACVEFAKRHFTDALGHYREAADSGYARANHWIAYIYQYGLGTEKNLGKARDYYLRGVAAGYLLAERGLLRLESQTGGIWKKPITFAKLIFLLIRTMAVARRNMNDPRLADVENAFGGPNYDRTGLK